MPNAKRRKFALALFLFLTALLAAAQNAGVQTAPFVRGVGAVAMTVSDLNRSVRFYSQVLAFQKTDEHDDVITEGEATLRNRTVAMRLGDEAIELTQFARPGAAIPADSRSNDLWFQHIAIIVSDIDRAYAILTANHVVSISPAPQRLPDWNKNAAGIRAFYFADPDGHPLEILQFPDAKGAEKWHRADRLFLGIDHTAIVVSNTDRSLRFYRDVLGLSVAGTSENFGPEQEKLNHVAGAHLRITTLRANSGPGIELLEYLAPSTGRELPFTPHRSDLVHRHTTLITEKVDKLGRAVELLRPAQTFLKPVANRSGEATGMFVDDPDGHELFIRVK